MSLWRTNGFRALSVRANLKAVAAVIGRPYREVLDAALWDSGNAIRSDAAPRAYSEVLADAIYALTEATRLTTFRVWRVALRGVGLGLVEFVEGECPCVSWPSRRPDDEDQVGQLDATSFGCDAIGWACPGVVVLGHLSPGFSRRCNASGGTHIVIVAEETWLALSTCIWQIPRHKP